MDILIKYCCINHIKFLLKRNDIKFNFFLEIYNPIEKNIDDKFLIKWYLCYYNNNEISLIKNKDVINKLILYCIFNNEYKIFKLLKNLFDFIDKELIFSYCLFSDNIKFLKFLIKVYPNFDIRFDEFFLLRRSIIDNKKDFIIFLLHKVNLFYISNINLMNPEFNLLPHDIKFLFKNKNMTNIKKI